MRFSFPKEKRLVSNRQFKAVLARGRRLSNELLTLYMAENDCSYPRLGVSVSKSSGNAVARNRLKRLLREVFRQSQDRIPAGFDYLIMISPQWTKKSDPRLRGDKFTPAKASAQSKKEMARQLTFEQVKDSFLALIQELKVS